MAIVSVEANVLGRTTEGFAPDAVKELRLALVCYGGMTSAFYTCGVVSEIHKLVKASQAFEDDHERNPFHANCTEFVYWQALQESLKREDIRTRVTVDVISGTSANAINAVCLAKALAHGCSLKPLLDLWLHGINADVLLTGPVFLPIRTRLLGHHLRELTQQRQTALLRGDMMSQVLYDVLSAMDGTGSTDDHSLVAPTRSLELLVTVTDLRGLPRYLYGSVMDRRHRIVLSFRRSAGVDEFGAAHSGALAFAAYASFCSPGLLPPANLKAFQAGLGGRHFDADGFADRFLPDYRMAYAQANDAFFMDGGMVDNLPFDNAHAAIARSTPAANQVQRRLLYIYFEQPTTATTQEPSRRQPGQQNTWTALTGTRNPESLSDNLIAFRARNERAFLADYLVEQSFADVRQRLAQLIRGLRAGGESTGAAIVAELMRLVHRDARQQLGHAYASYVTLKLRTVTDRLATFITRALEYPPETGPDSFIHAVIGAWVESLGLLQPGMQEAERLYDFLATYDLPYGERRLGFLIYGINKLYLDSTYSTDRAMRRRLDSAKRWTYDALQELRAVALPWGLVGLEPEPFQLFSWTQLQPWLRGGQVPKQFAEQHVGDVSDLATAIGRYYDTSLEGFRERLWDGFAKETLGWPEEARRTLLIRFLGFPLWDAMLFPISSQGSQHFGTIMLHRISPQDSMLFPNRMRGVTRPDPLGVIPSRAARESDYLWGRLQASEQLLRLIASPDLEWSRKAAEAVFHEEENRLPNIRTLISHLR